MSEQNTENKAVRVWTPKEASCVPFLRGILSQETVKKRAAEILGENAGAFVSSIITLASGSSQLQKCEPSTIYAAAFAAASCKLSLEKSLGHAYLVPFWNSKENHYEAQFQVGWKGFVQLAERSGQYQTIHVTAVYKDEVRKIDHVHGLYEFAYVEGGMRDKENVEDIAGFYSMFRLNNGFTKEMYMSYEQVQAHAKKFSQSYRQDLEKGWRKSIWTTDPVGMSMKTLCKLLLNRWGILSVEMQKAIAADQAVDDEYIDNSNAIDTTAENASLPASVQKQLTSEPSEKVTIEDLKKKSDEIKAKLENNEAKLPEAEETF